MEQFPIGCWTYCDLEETYPNMVKDWHDLGINNPLSPYFGPNSSKEDMLRLLDECAQYQMSVFVYDYRTLWRTLSEDGEQRFRRGVADAIADFGGHPAVKGFYVGDEPDAPDAADALMAARIQRELAPQLCPYLNLLPWFDWIGERIGSPAYAPYLDRVVREGNIPLLAYDCYTQMWEGDSGWDVYFDNLREHMEAGRRNGVPFCSTLLSMGHYDYRCPSVDDFRWQISTAAAFGAKSIAWFYIHLRGVHDNYRQPAINPFNERTTTFEWLSNANRLFQHQFGGRLMELQAEDVRFVGKAYGGASLFEPTETVLGADNDKGCPMLLSRFSDKKGGRYWVLVNLDLTKNISANLHLADGVRLQQCRFDGGFTPVQAVTDAVGQMAYGKSGSVASVRLAPGQMELFCEG